MLSTRSLFGTLTAATWLLLACSSNTAADNHNLAGASSGGAATTAGSGGAGAGVSAGSGGASTAATLDQDCSAQCSAQAASACPKANCQSDCVQAASKKLEFGPTCTAEYTAMAHCEAALSGDKWTCSSDENAPIPAEGQCTQTVCAWACCATDLIVPSDIWARCLSSCPESGGGGAPGAGGSPGTAGNSSTGGSGGDTTVAGAAGATSEQPPTPVGIPAGYPAPTADNAAKCSTVPMSGGFCPGGGAGPVCLRCLFGSTSYNTSETPPAPADAIAAAGDYVVSTQLGSVGPVFVSAESSRGLLSNGLASQSYAFVVDVRPMEGQPNHAGGPVGYAGLDLFFSGPAGLKVTAIGYARASANTKPVMVYIAGDSTVCDQTGNVYGGWGQMLPQYFAPPVGIANYANSGAASGSFNTYWNMIKAKWTAGDWVMIQFGHNDGSTADSVVQANLEKMVADAQAANVTPILVSPPARVQGFPITDQSSLHAAAAKAAAAAKKCAYIDLTALSTAWYDTLPDKATALSYHAEKGATHTNLAGADKLAQLIAKNIKAQSIGLAKYLRP
jgi:lysophospholipase L1-like esterase